jgi:hypothetical protein
MTPEEYTAAIDRVNAFLKPSRSNALDVALLTTGVLMVPLALWGIRHASQTKKRKQLLKNAIDDFNIHNSVQHPDLLMRWNRRPESFLSIERRRVPNNNEPNDNPKNVETYEPDVQERQRQDDDDSMKSDSDNQSDTRPIQRLSPLDEIHDLL